MDQKCPGRKNMYIDVTLLTCSQCGASVEIFTDEVRAHCRCGRWLYRDTIPLCAQWCPEAERCFGAAGSFKKSFDEACQIADKDEQERRLKELQRLIAEAHAHCPNPEIKAVPVPEVNTQ